MKNLKELLIKSPDSQLDSSMKTIIQKWSDTPSSLEILEVLDKTIYSSLGSGFVVQTLEMMLNQTLQLENKTLEEISKLAEWRKN